MKQILIMVLVLILCVGSVSAQNGEPANGGDVSIDDFINNPARDQYVVISNIDQGSNIDRGSKYVVTAVSGTDIEFNIIRGYNTENPSEPESADSTLSQWIDFFTPRKSDIKEYGIQLTSPSPTGAHAPETSSFDDRPDGVMPLPQQPVPVFTPGPNSHFVYTPSEPFEHDGKKISSIEVYGIPLRTDPSLTPIPGPVTSSFDDGQRLFEDQDEVFSSLRENNHERLSAVLSQYNGGYHVVHYALDDDKKLSRSQDLARVSYSIVYPSGVQSDYRRDGKFAQHRFQFEGNEDLEAGTYFIVPRTFGSIVHKINPEDGSKGDRVTGSDAITIKGAFETKHGAEIRNAINQQLANKLAEIQENVRLTQSYAQQFFGVLDAAASSARDFSGYSSIFMSKSDIGAWRESRDQIFADLYLGTEYWASAVCQGHLDVPNKQVAFYEHPSTGQTRVTAHVGGEKLAVIQEDDVTTFLYRLEFFAVNPRGGHTGDGEGTMCVRVRLQPGDVELFDEPFCLKPGETVSRAGSSAIAQYSATDYDRICIHLSNAPRLITGGSTMCDRIVFKDTQPTMLPDPTAVGGDQQGSGPQGQSPQLQDI